MISDVSGFDWSHFLRQRYQGCDDGNMLDGDGCSSSCAVETGWVCEAMRVYQMISDLYCRHICSTSTNLDIHIQSDSSTEV